MTFSKSQASPVFAIFLLFGISCGKKSSNYPHPKDNPDFTLMLYLPGSGSDPEAIDFDSLPVLKAKHGIVTKGDGVWHYRLHSYLVHFAGRFWCMWSHGPIVEDKPTQHIRYSTSPDGTTWTEPKILVGP